MRESVEKRLAKLEAPATAGAVQAVVVFYDAETGLPLKPIPPTATTLIWMPINGREDERN